MSSMAMKRAMERPYYLNKDYYVFSSIGHLLPLLRTYYLGSLTTFRGLTPTAGHPGMPKYLSREVMRQ